MTERQDPVDAGVAAARQVLDPPWDDVRQQRVLSQTLEGARRARVLGRARRVSIASAFGVAAIAAGSLLLFGKVGSQGSQQVAESPSARLAPNLSTVTFADGSHARLSPGARLGTAEHAEMRVSVAQEAGTVAYEVRQDPERAFVVRARNVEVTVLGTSFSVELLEAAVEVRVSEGRVRVHDGKREVVLVGGEDLRIATPQQAALRMEEPVRAGDAEAVVPSTEGAALRAEEAPSPPKAAGVDELLARADGARRNGQLDTAARALTELVAAHSADPRATSALFTLGRVERARGRHSEAARAFRGCHTRSPAGSLAEDALAEEASSWALAGQAGAASSAAQRYLRTYPGGSHAERMRQMLE